MANYLNDVDLYYEIVLSKAKGKLTPNAERLLILIANNISNKFYYYNPNDRFDCLQTGTMMMLLKWHLFNEHKYMYALPYFSEICKRGMAQGLNELQNKKHNGEESPMFISMSSVNEGQGMFNI